ncbi:hypothetical protein K1Y30_01685 [Staphylococcus arlettae]|uniref:hypothetical protein n=1 Tax=Staphylococcus arlettae TaxID=29378 RepID=UPI001E43650F|nr:hypothetical protein [Staphylococcus arlettae]MCD8840519.1 hypothetical protein [Staphylococcus arlettae]
MKKLKSNILLDSLLTFSLIMTLCLEIIPLTYQLETTLQNQLNKLEAKKILLYDLTLSKTIDKKSKTIAQYKITYHLKNVCIKNHSLKEDLCYEYKNKKL